MWRVYTSVTQKHTMYSFTQSNTQKASINILSDVRISDLIYKYL
jgi:hypothetical protein